MKKEVKYGSMGVVSLVAVAFVFYMAYSVIPRALVTLTKASPSSKISIDNSYLLADKILAISDGVDEARVNVYVMDKSGKGIPSRAVSLSGMDGIKGADGGLTNQEGKAVFSMISAKPGQFTLEADVEGTPMVQKITVTFREL